MDIVTGTSLKHNPRLICVSAGYESLHYAQRASQCMSSSPSQAQPNSSTALQNVSTRPGRAGATDAA